MIDPVTKDGCSCRHSWHATAAQFGVSEFWSSSKIVFMIMNVCRLARRMEAIVRETGATPATIALLDGKIHVGLDNTELERLADPSARPFKVSTRDLATALVSVSHIKIGCFEFNSHCSDVSVARLSRRLYASVSADQFKL